MEKYDWLEFALCRGSDVNLFFPDVGVSYHQTDYVRNICASCPVSTECLELGLESGNDEHGFFGGKSPRERQAIRAERARAARAPIRTANSVPNNEPTETLGMGQQNQAGLA